MIRPEAGSPRWKMMDELLGAAFDLPEEQRSAFLDQACGGDQELKRSIEDLLVIDQRADSFIETPAFQATTKNGDSNLASIFQSESQIQPGKVIAGRYRILSRLGKGGMSEVWHAYDEKLRVDLALKSLHFNLKGTDYAFDILRHEVLMAREVISPNVCRIFDLVTDEEREFATMEYIDGITLMQILEEKGPLKLQDAREIAVQFLAGLDAIHEAGLVHRDLKPENIMITRTGRVVVMDLGIAQQQRQTAAMISGTRPYMSPEQLAGEEVDARSDIFAAGVVLAEMIYTRGASSGDIRKEVWRFVRHEPGQLPDSAWKEIIQRAAAFEKVNRFESAIALSRALEEVALRDETLEDRAPYPGLASFTPADSDYFLGREKELEMLLLKIQQLFLMALVGPSGAGKTSFVKAGLIPALPKQWKAMIAQPGDTPLLNLRQSLASLLSKDETPHSEFLLIVDRFEELFTLNLPEIQSEFVRILERALLESNIRILLVMRDDFLIRCKDFESLAPMFSELTVLGPLNGAALRRALVEPAMKCGYRFEDEVLIHEILSDIEKERSALPLLSFAAASLWERRDRAKGKLTQEAYRAIGGVRGALAQHAERTMEQIGQEKESIVRELFRNLVTAENTRASCPVEELLSLFSDRKEAAAEVLDSLIGARLLTSFEARNNESDNTRRVEISHESLITEWPRLVKWQNQDLESVQFREELRNASRLWDQKDRSEHLLWSGIRFLEFQLWRRRYAENLTATEDAFAHAMIHHANKKRRQRRIALAITLMVLFAVVSGLTYLWRQATVAKNTAISETKRAEASKVLAIGRAITNLDPSTKLAYALRSLEFADTDEARQFAMQAMSEGPLYHIIPVKGIAQMSPDARWIALATFGGGFRLIPGSGAPPVTVSQSDLPPQFYIPWDSQFSPDSEFLLWTSRKNPWMIHVWSFSQMKIVRTFQFEGLTICFVRAGKAFFITDLKARDNPFFWQKCKVRVWNFGAEEPQALGQINLHGAGWKSIDIDSQGRWILYPNNDSIYAKDLQQLEKTPPD